ncbi:hypothetical protein FRC09_000484 [Ceratobasidium sp. 395]|nr:hypothetical protein FRC09_000484 [Ceratobasidium sp. 395]
MYSLVDQSLKPCSRSPNKAAFALASWALIELDRLPVTKWVTNTVELLESHCNDSATLDSEALSMLVKSISYVFGAHTFDHAPLLLVLVRVLASSRSSGSQIADRVGVALIICMLLQPVTTLNQSSSGVHPEARSEDRRANCMQFLNAVKHPERIPLDLIGIGLLELLKHLPQTHERQDLVIINEILQKYAHRPDGLEIQGFVIAKSGYNSRYLTDVVIPRVEPADDGSFADSEPVRATYLSVVNMKFLDTLTDPERLEAVKLGLANLESATTNCLKQSCCNLIRDFAQCDFFYENGDLRRGESVTPLLPLFPLLPLLPLLHFTESTDERVLPYAMRALWKITDLVGFSTMSAEQKQTILDPVLSHEPFVSARSKTNDQVYSSAKPAKDTGYAEVWLSRLEKIQGEALRHIYRSNVLETISPDVWYDFLNSNSELDSRSIRGRALALFRRCISEDTAAGERPLWPLNDDLAAP